MKIYIIRDKYSVLAVKSTLELVQAFLNVMPTTTDFNVLCFEIDGPMYGEHIYLEDIDK